MENSWVATANCPGEKIVAAWARVVAMEKKERIGLE